MFLSISSQPSDFIVHNPSVFYVSPPSRDIVGQGQSSLIICQLTDKVLNYTQAGPTVFQQIALAPLPPLTERLWLNSSPRLRHRCLSFHCPFCLPAKETLNWKSGKEKKKEKKKWVTYEEATEADCMKWLIWLIVMNQFSKRLIVNWNHLLKVNIQSSNQVKTARKIYKHFEF